MYKPCVLDEYITNHCPRHCMSETSNYKLVVFDSETLRNDTFLVKLTIVQENYIPIEYLQLQAYTSNKNITLYLHLI